MTQRHEQDQSWRQKIFDKSSLRDEGLGQDEGRKLSLKEAIKALQQYFPDVVITQSNYQNYLKRWLKGQ